MNISELLPSTRVSFRFFQFLGMLALLFGMATSQALAQVIDDIKITKIGNEAEINLHFITKIRYVRNVVLKNGDIRIYVTLQNIDPTDPRLQWEQKDSPPSTISLPFTVIYPELDSSLTLSFGKAVEYRVSAGHDGQSVSIFTPVIAVDRSPKENTKVKIPDVAPPLLPVPIIDPAVDVPAEAIDASVAASVSDQAVATPESSAEQIMTPEAVEQEAQKLFVAASDALQTNQIDKTVAALNKLLDLPPNALSQAAQKLMGEAREKNGDYVKARAEYELYLKLYPKASDVKQVKVLLANLPKDSEVKRMKGEPSEAVQQAAEEKLQVSGGISQNYFGGVSHTDTFAIDGAGNPTTFSTDATDQSQLITSLDLSARKRTQKLDTRLVLREYSRLNFLPGQRDEFRWNAVYVEQSARDRKFMYRLGRQSGSWGGVPGRFDGLAGGYSISESWRINVAAGLPVEYASGGWDPGDQRTFTSLNVELTRLPNQWSGSAYVLMQNQGGFTEKSGGVPDRRAWGLEAHYFEQQRNYMMQAEYDTLFKKVNLVTFQGNWTRESGANFFLMMDHRRSPPLAFNMQGMSSQSVKEVLSKGEISIDKLRDNAIALSMISNMVSVGASKPVSSKLRLSTDFRVSNTGGTGEVTTDTLPQIGVAGSGNQYALTLQAIGNNLLFENDLGIASATFTKSDQAKGQSLTFSQVNTFNSKWRMDLSLMLFNQTTSFDTRQRQIRPSVTVNYRMNKAWNFVGEAGIEQFRTTSASSSDKTQRQYYYLGYRWDFR